MGLGRLLGVVLGGGLKGFAGETMVAAGAMLALPSATYVRFPRRDAADAGRHDADRPRVRFAVRRLRCGNEEHGGLLIFGSERDGRWTQVLPGGRKTSFQNPLRQNYRHMKAVEAALGKLELPAGAVRSVVAFVGDAELKTPLPENVTVGMGFARYVKSFMRPVMSEAAVLAVCDALATARIDGSMAARRAHVRRLRSCSDPAMAQKCPRCGRDMVLRTSRRGRERGTKVLGLFRIPVVPDDAGGVGRTRRGRNPPRHGIEGGNVAKYDPLGDFLGKRRGSACTLTHANIEEILGAPLPPGSKRYRAWWGNEAGYMCNAGAGWDRGGWSTTGASRNRVWCDSVRAK